MAWLFQYIPREPRVEPAQVSIPLTPVCDHDWVKVLFVHRDDEDGDHWTELGKYCTKCEETQSAPEGR